MVPQDRRVQRTQNLLAKALIALTLERGYEAITIQDITERAEVGYATFFRHYRNKEALLEEVVEVVLADLLERLSPPVPTNPPSEVGLLLFEFVETHSQLIQVLLHSRGLAQAMERVVETSTEKMLKDWQGLPDSPIPAEIAANHVVTASIALIQWWLDHNKPYPVSQMGQIYYQLIMQPTVSLAFQFQPDKLC